MAVLNKDLKLRVFYISQRQKICVNFATLWQTFGTLIYYLTWTMKKKRFVLPTTIRLVANHHRPAPCTKKTDISIALGQLLLDRLLLLRTTVVI